VSRALVALRPVVVEKKMPLVMHADSAQAIRRALKVAREFGLRPVIEGAAEAYAVAPELKAAGAAVLLSASLPEAPRVTPGEEDPSTLQGLRQRALAPTSAAALAKAGVPFAITAGGLSNPADFTKAVRRMVAAGLPVATAVEATTISPAKLLGVDRQLGTLEAGKVANVLVTSGDLYADKTQVKYLFVDGKKQDTDAPRPAGGGGAGRGSFAASLPPGVTPEQALQFLRQNPNAAARFLPAGTTAEQAIAELEGGSRGAAQGESRRTDDDSVKAPAPVGEGLVPPLPAALPAAFVLRNADAVWTSGPQGVVKNADVYVKDGKVVSVGQGLKVPAGTPEVDARGKQVTPGMIDCHSHTAIDGGVNEGSNSVTAECRIQDVIDAEDVNIYRQLAGGTTAANLLHGSANAIGGQNAVVKWRWGKTADELLVAGAPQGVKFALGENPKQSNFRQPGRPLRYPSTRMGVERVIRETFVKARDYKAQWDLYKAGKLPAAPRRDLQMDAVVEILEGKRLVHCHSYRSDEILMMTRLADEFGFKVATFQHVLEGYKVADELAKHGAGGSTFSDWWAFKIEAWDAIPYNGALMNQRGVLVSFNSDDAELARRLNLEAAKAVHWGGVAPEEALKFVTINPAKQLRIDKMTGSLEPGKDADLVVWSGDPLSTKSVCEKTFVDGRLYFDRQADLTARDALEAEKKRLAAAERPATPARRAPAAGTVAADATPVTRAEGATRSNGTLAPAAQAKLAGPVTAIVGGTVHPVTGPAIENGVVLMQGGKIAAVGSVAAVAVPDGAAKVDAAGLHVYPGLIDGNTGGLGLTEIGSLVATQDSRELGEFSPELRAAVAVNPDSELIKVARANGVLAGLTAPTGGTFSGMGALLCLDGWTWEEMAENPAVGLFVNFPATGGRRFREMGHRCEETAGDPYTEESLNDPALQSGADVPAGSRDNEALRLGQLPLTAQGPAAPAPAAPQTPSAPSGEGNRAADPDAALKPMNDFIAEARRYQRVKAAGGADAIRAHDPRLEAMLPVLDGKLPVFVRASRERDIRSAVRWAKANGFKLVIVGGREADKAADLLVKENVPVILGEVLDLPSRYDAPYDEAFTLPARLTKAGVRFCLSTGAASDVRRLPYHAAMASAFGLPADEALKAITLYPAQILGAGNRLGSLEPGKDADVILTTGDPLEITSVVKAAYCHGEAVDLGNKQVRLYERYKGRPKK
jgi:imidazolonepropionase-like amidohydrolase